jgi:hypothetical protein
MTPIHPVEIRKTRPPLLLICGLFWLLQLIGCAKTSPPPSTSSGTTTTKPALPASATITTSPVIGIAFDSATAGGNISLNGDSTPILDAGISIDTLPNPGINKIVIGMSISSGAFKYTLTDLHPNTVYHVRAFIQKLGNIFVFGQDVSFTTANYIPPVGYFFFTSQINALCADLNGNIYAAGDLFGYDQKSGAYYSVSEWNGSSWTPSTGLTATLGVSSLYTNRAGNVFAGAGTQSGWGVSEYNGGAWNQVGAYNIAGYLIIGVCADGVGNTYAIGTLQNASGKYYVGKWGPGGYSELGSFDELPQTICTDAAGNLYVGGLMNNGYQGMLNWGNYYIAKWDGISWTEMGAFNDIITSIVFDKAGNMLVAGAFTLDPAGNIQSGGPSENASGVYYVAKWNGTTWSALGNLGLGKYYGNSITQMCVDPSGNVYAIGDFKDASGNYYVEKWNGSSWQEMASFNNRINAVCSDIHGNIYAAGNFQLQPGQWYVAKCN